MASVLNEFILSHQLVSNFQKTKAKQNTQGRFQLEQTLAVGTAFLRLLILLNATMDKDIFSITSPRYQQDLLAKMEAKYQVNQAALTQMFGLFCQEVFKDTTLLCALARQVLIVSELQKSSVKDYNVPSFIEFDLLNQVNTSTKIEIEKMSPQEFNFMEEDLDPILIDSKISQVSKVEQFSVMEQSNFKNINDFSVTFWSSTKLNPQKEEECLSFRKQGSPFEQEHADKVKAYVQRLVSPQTEMNNLIQQMQWRPLRSVQETKMGGVESTCTVEIYIQKMLCEVKESHIDVSKQKARAGAIVKTLTRIYTLHPRIWDHFQIVKLKKSLDAPLLKQESTSVKKSTIPQKNIFNSKYLQKIPNFKAYLNMIVAQQPHLIVKKPLQKISSGQPHCPIWKVKQEVKIPNTTLVGVGEMGSVKNAEEKAARQIIEQIIENHPHLIKNKTKQTTLNRLDLIK